MSRRKQSNPRPLKTEKSEDDIEEVARTHNLPGDVLHLRDSESSATNYTVHTSVTLTKGTTFGPYRGSKVKSLDLVKGSDLEEAKQEENEINACTLQIVDDGKTSVFRINEDAGLWLKLLHIFSPTAQNATANISLHIQDGSIHCEVTEDVQEGGELVAMLINDSDTKGDIDIEEDLNQQNRESLITEKEDNSFNDSLTSKNSTPPPQQVAPPKCSNPPPEFSEDRHYTKSRPSRVNTPVLFPLLHVCVYCGVRFSSESTLLAHHSFYCSKKPPLLPQSVVKATSSSTLEDSTDADKMVSEGNIKKAPAGKKRLLQDYQENERAERERSQSSDSAHSTENTSSPTTEPSPKLIKSNEVFRCMECDFETDDRKSLNIHQAAHGDAQLDEERYDPRVSRGFLYCHECNIQFTSVTTYQGHKEMYCQQRHAKRLKGRHHQQTMNNHESEHKENLMSAALLEKMASSIVSNMMLPMMPSLAPGGPTLPMIPGANFSALMAAQMSAAGIPTSQAAVLLSTPMMTANGFPNMPFNVPAIVVQPQSTEPTINRSSTVPDKKPAEKDKKRPLEQAKDESEQPLDLSIKKPKHETRHEPESPKQSKMGVTLKSPNPVKDKRESMNGRSPRLETPRPLTPGRIGKRSPSSSPRRASYPGLHPSPKLNLSPTTPPLGMLPQIPPSMHLLPSPMLAGVSPNVLAHVNKCNDCNIVFYKQENYVAHKEHYCAGRNQNGNSSSQDRDTPLVKPYSPFGSVSPASSAGYQSDSKSPASIKSSSPISATSAVSPGIPAGIQMGIPPVLPPAKLLEMQALMEASILQYYCIPCKIKFSSVDTLKAHQKHYCPHRSQDVPGNQHEKKDVDKAGESSGLSCTHCGAVFVSSRLLKLHYCTGMAVHLPLFSCPYCDYIAQSDNRLIEHIKAHAPSKAYKCTLCGYRGNTVRGMRMHGKMHIDAGEKFTDDSMVEFEEPPLIPKRLKSIDPSSVVDIETELLRFKNEPYKRRKSRKAYEKVDSRYPNNYLCEVCRAAFTDITELHQHMNSHMEEQNFSCKSCDYVTDSKAKLVHHVKALHEVSSPVSPTNNNSHDINSGFQGKILVIKPENDTESYDMSEEKQSSPQVPLSSPDINSMSLKQNNIGSNSGSPRSLCSQSPERHYSPHSSPKIISPEGSSSLIMKRTYSPEESKTMPILSPQGILDSDRIFTKDVTAPRTPEKQIFKLDSPNAIFHIKSEDSSSHDGSTKWTPEKPDNQTTNQHDGKPSPDFKQTNGISTMANGSTHDVETLLQKKGGAKYCKSCDITFTYLSTFVAHKKYYCSSHVAERNPAQTEV